MLYFLQSFCLVQWNTATGPLRKYLSGRLAPFHMAYGGQLKLGIPNFFLVNAPSDSLRMDKKLRFGYFLRLNTLKLRFVWRHDRIKFLVFVLVFVFLYFESLVFLHNSRDWDLYFLVDRQLEEGFPNVLVVLHQLFIALLAYLSHCFLQVGRCRLLIRFVVLGARFRRFGHI